MTAGAGGAAAPGGVGPAPLRTWALFGFRVATDHLFVNHVPRTEGDAELTVRYVNGSPLAGGWDREPPAYASPATIDGRRSFLYVHTVGACAVLRFSEVVDFYIWPDVILCHVLDPAYAFMVELHLLGFVMSYWLEGRGLAAIHAAAVVSDDGAIGFLSTNKGGKSSLAAGFMKAGWPLLTDDILPLDATATRVSARPSYPQMRMWPDQTGHFWGSDEEFEQVHPTLAKRRIPVGPGGFGRYCAEAQRLGRLYVPERRDGGTIDITDLSFADAVFALARYSFLSDIVEAVDVHRDRFATLARIARCVPVRRVSYPSGVDLLPDVVAAIAADAADAGRDAP